MNLRTIPEVTLYLGISALESWKTALNQLETFNIHSFQKDFITFIEPLYQNSPSYIQRFVLEVAKNPKILFDHERYLEELIALSELLEIRFELLLFQNIIYEIHCVANSENESQGKVSNAGGCTAVVCLIEGVPTLGRNIDFQHFEYWRRYSFNARLIDADRKDIGIVNFPAVGTISITTGLRFDSHAVAINARVAGPIDCSLISFMLNGKLPQICLRKSIEHCESYSAAKAYLTATKLIAPAYFTIIGVDSAERCILRRERNPAENDPYCFAGTEIQENIVQTNVDHDLQLDMRYHTAQEEFRCLNQSRASPPSLDWLNILMLKPPILNALTFSTFLISAKTNLFSSRFIDQE